MTYPCKDCPHRTVTCHGSCEEYKQARRENDEAIRRRQQENENMRISRQHEMIIRKNIKRRRKSWSR